MCSVDDDLYTLICHEDEELKLVSVSYGNCTSQSGSDTQLAIALYHEN